MADYHMLGDNMYSMAGSGMMEESPNMVNPSGYGHAGSMNAPGMMQQGMSMGSQNPGAIMQGMVPMQAQQSQQSGSQMPPGNMSSYHQGAVHVYPPNEVPQKLHQYSSYSSQMQPGSMGGQFMPGGPRLHHMGDSMAGTAAAPQAQQNSRSIVPNQMAYQNRAMSGNHYGQQMMHSNSAPSQMAPNASQYPSQYASASHHQYQQHPMQQMNQPPDVWQGSINHPQMSRPCMPQSQNYPSHQPMPAAQHSNSSMTHSPLTMQAQRPATPNQSQYIGAQDYPVQQHPSAQAVQMQRSSAYNLNSSTINQNGTHIGQGPAAQPGLSQSYSSLPQQNEPPGMTFPQGHYTPPSQVALNRPHYSPSSTAGSAVPQQPTQQHLVAQQNMMSMRPSMHQMGYPSVSSRVNSGQQHSGTLPPGSPARLQQQYQQPPFSPNQPYPTAAAQPSPCSVTSETATPPHMPHYSQAVAQSPTSPQYRGQFPSQLTQSPQHLAATPPAEASAPTSSCTPDRSHHSTPVPQSQGSFPSPSATHMSSPGHGQSPGNSTAPSNSLQHLEMMVSPHVSIGQSPTSNNAPLSNVGSSSNTGMSNSNSAMSANYYGHHHVQSQQHHPHMSTGSEARPQPLSPAVLHVTPQQHPHHSFAGLNISLGQQNEQQSPVSSVPNSQPVPPTQMNASHINPIPTIEDNRVMEQNQCNSMVGYKSISNSSNSSNNSNQGMVPTDASSVAQHLSAPPELMPSVVNQAPPSHMSPVPTNNQAPMPMLPQQHNVPPQQQQQQQQQYPGPPSITFELQQELQQLRSTNQTPEVVEKIKVLQDQLMYLQGPNADLPTGPQPMSGPMPSSYPTRPPAMYGGSQQMSYMHQQPVQPHTVHYNPQPQQPPVTTMSHDRPMPVYGPQPNHLMNEMYSNSNPPPFPPQDQDSLEMKDGSQTGFPPHMGDPMGQLPPPSMPVDPYEMNFNDEPPKKLKRRAPKEPKEPKPPKEKKPKPKKPKKPKNAVMGPLPEGAAVPPLPGLNENLELGNEIPPILGPDGTPLDIETPDKKKKGKKRKTKEKDNLDASTEPKEPKVKKPKKKYPKKPKVPPVPKPEGDTVENAEENHVPVAGEEVTPKVVCEPGAEPTTPGKSDKKKDKSHKSKSPKTPSTGKESKKSSPKKKLPKIALRFTSKKKKKKPIVGSSAENSDMEKTPPPSPDDGDGIQKRRSARNTNRKKYTDDIELHLTDDETIEMEFGQSPILNSEGKVVQVVMDSHTDDHMVVEKILAVRTVQKQPDVKTGSDAENSNSVSESCEEYYVKYKNLSYIHCEWRTLEELEKGDRRFIQKVKRFKQKKAEFNIFDFLSDEPFNPDYIEVDRVLDVTELPELTPFGNVKDLQNSNNQEEDKIKSEDTKSETSTDVKDIVDKEVSDSKEESAAVDPVTENTEKDLPAAEPVSEPVKQEVESEEADGNSDEKSEETTTLVKTPEPTTLVKTPEPTILVKTPEPKDELPDEMEPVPSPAEDEKIKTENEEAVPNAETKVEEVEQKSNSDNKENIVAEKKESKLIRHYLVKWRALTYEESTWELEDDVDPSKIEQFEKFRMPPPKEKWKFKKQPKPSEWEKNEESKPYKGGNTLREYQLEGVNWLTFCWYNSQNCILADEMGLGKTIQSIAYLHEIDLYGIPGPFLIIAPLSTIGNWQREFETWTDMNTITYHGSSLSRNMILEYEMYWKNEKGERIQDIYKFQVLITTFEIILTDCVELKAIPWRSVIIDEAHRLKNRNCKLLEGLRLLNTEHRVLLTGTPLQNNVEELFSLLNFLEPNRFASTEAFLEEFGDLKTESQVDKLKALLKPMMLRRLKEDVEKSLAPKEETVIEVELTNVQKKYYRAILERNFTFLTKGNCYSNIPNLMNTMMELRKCCIHPFLINGAEEQITNDYRSQHEDCSEVQLSAMVQASGKLVLTDKLLPRLRAEGHRVLIFSQMVKCLDILEDYMVQKRYPFERIDGRVRGNLRQAAIDRFCKPDSDRFVFLLCTRAGGLGINLTAADTVIIFDSDWNPQNDLQAQARCHRIGQSKAVKVYRLICRNTYEREMFDRASLKLGLDRAVLQSMCPSKDNVGGANQPMSKKEVEDLLRKGAYGALMEDDNAGDKFCEEDIDQILQRRTQVIHLESGTQGSTFSKATFASASTRSDIEIDDPNFWEKWAKKANLDVDELKNRNELIIQEPRRRTQTRRFGTDDHMLDLSDLDTSDDDDESVSTRTRASRRSSKYPGGKRPKNRGRALDREKDDEYMEEIAPGNWTRAECFKVEKGLLTFGWGRWNDCIALGQFRRRLTYKDCEHISRTILLYCLLHYKGDEKIKSFIWDLICPTYDGEQPIHRNHSEVELIVEKDCEELSAEENGLSAPVPRGRKGKKLKKEMKAVDAVIEESEWAKEEQYNPDVLLSDDAYRKHLNRHANKVLLRVRLLYYLKHEIIGDLSAQVFANIPASLIPLDVPPCDGEMPAPWWDREVDKSLLLGIYKHGFERYNLMRQDPTLCFLMRCGPPDGAALLAELKINEEELADQNAQEELAEKEGKLNFDNVDDMEPLSPSSDTHSSKPLDSHASIQSFYEKHQAMLLGIPIFPSITDVNTRVRRLITAYQRNNKKLEIRNAQKARKIERREKFEAAIRERELKKRELQQRKWSRREEADFYRTISSFGIEYTEDKKDYNWSRFRNIARLERKFDETLAEYYKSFYAMCKRVCGKKLTEEEEQLSFIVDPISEERASRCLQRVDLLHKIREEILVHPELDERLKLCQPSMDLPDWWQCGKHDKDLLIGASKHGLCRMDYHLLHDSTLCFKDVLKNHTPTKSSQISSHVSTPIGCSSPITTCQSAEETPVKDDPNLSEGEKEDELKSSVKKNSDVLFENVKETKTEATECKPEKSETEKPAESDASNIVDEAKIELESKQEAMDFDADAAIVKCEDKVDEEEKIIPGEESSTPPPINGNNVVEEPMDTSSASKNDEDEIVDNEKQELVAEETKMDVDKDDDTDIESDIKKEDVSKEDNGDMVTDTVQLPVKVEDAVKTPEPPVLELEKCDQKYDCETDTEVKPAEVKQSEQEVSKKAVEPVTNNESLSEQQEKLTEVKQEPVKTEDERKESFPKDEIHIDDSQGGISQNDEVMSQASFNFDPELGEPTVAQLLAITTGNSVRWPKDKVLQIRLEHVVQAIEKNEWPVIRPIFLTNFPGTSVSTSTTPAPRTGSPSPHMSSPAPSVTSREGHSREATPLATPEPPPIRESPMPDIQIAPPEFVLRKKNQLPPSSAGPAVTGEVVKQRRRRRRRRFEIEAERVKLRQLLSHNIQQQPHHHQQQLQHVQQFLASSNASLLRNKLWEEISELPGVSQPTSVLVPPPVICSTAPSIPPPAHQNSSPRLSTTLGSLDLRVKSSLTAPISFSPMLQPSKKSSQTADDRTKSLGSPLSPIDLSASAPSSGHAQQKSSHSSSTRSLVKTRLREGRSSRGGSRIDALALNLQARKQQQLMQEQHHDLPGDLSTMLDMQKMKEMSEQDDHPPPRHHHHHHSEKRSLEEEEAKLRRKRLQFSEDAVRKSLSKAIEMSRAPPAHSSFMNSPLGTLSGSGRMHLGSKGDDHPSSINPLLDHSGLMHHDFKKWLEEHPELVATNPNLVAAAAAAMAFNPVPSFPSHTELLELPEGRRRGRRPRLDPSKIDYEKVTGEENVSVINRLTGKKITGSKAPPLKHLTEWLDKNPMFDVDPKWGPLVREKGNLPNSMMNRIVTPSEKRGRRTAASLLASAHQTLPAPPSSMSFPSASSLNPLSFANTGMLAGFPNMNFFKDPPKVTSAHSSSNTTTTATSSSNPPIFLPFGGLAGMGLTNPLFGFPGFNFAGLQGASALSAAANLPLSKDQSKDSEKSKSDITSSRNKSLPVSTSSSSLMSGAGLPSATSMPFLYPAPGLLYNPLGLGGFTLPPNLPASFASFTQSGLVNGLGLGNPLITTSSMSSAATSLVSSASTIPSTSHAPLGSSSTNKHHHHGYTGGNSKRSPSHSSLLETQDTDDESLKSLMGTHDDDEDEDLDKLEHYDNLERDDSDRDVFRDAPHRGKASRHSSGRTSSKASESEVETSLKNKNSRRVSTDLPFFAKPKGISDEPTSDSTDTEGKTS